ncbi:AbrB/MazE/SpoVT family DNA-binding domain-containing protein [Candidatus Kaiserbacteria bacterium]|nr:AbrB/MazE/SpoVT family DNA-binding domain-containing protein [Candidatus Kaiserbacteria bacterium]
MTTMIKMQARGVLTLPKKVRTRMGIDAGDIVELVEQDGKVFIAPVSRIDKGLQEDIRSALEDLRLGRTIGPFANMKEFQLYRKSKGKK